jgi:outer membrane protein TolC
MRPTLYCLSIISCTLVLSTAAVRSQQPVQIAQAEASNRQPAADTKPADPRPYRGLLTRPVDLTRVGVQQAQTLPLSLQEAIRRALANNNDIEVSRGDVRFQETQVRALQGVYDPVFTTTPTYSRSSTTGSSATNDFRANAGISGFIEPGGGNYQTFFNNARTENAFTQAQLSSGSVSGGSGAIYTSSLGFAYNQPLFRNFRIDTRRYQIAIAKRRLAQTDADFQLRATNTITDVQRAYWDYVFALRNQQNQVANVNLARENLRQIEAKIEAGAAAPLERAEVETELANREGDLLLATQQVGTTENTLKQLIIREPLSNEWGATITPTDNPTVNFDPINLDNAMQDAMDNRFELRRLRFQREINTWDIRYFKNQTKPQIDLNSTFSLDGLSSGGSNGAINTNLLTNASDLFLLNSLNSTRTAVGLPALVNPPITIPASPSFLFGGFNRSLANLFRRDSPNFSVGMTISFPFRNRTAKANLQGARIQGEQLDAQTRGQEQVVIVEVRNAVQAVETARQRVLTARRALANAEIQLTGEQKLYEAGRSTTFLLFQRENTLTNARNAVIRAETDFNKAIADLQRVTSTAFKANNITVDEPVPGIR